MASRALINLISGILPCNLLHSGEFNMNINELNEILWEMVLKCSTQDVDMVPNDEINLATDLNYTSVEIIQLIVQVELNFNIEIPDSFLGDDIYIYKRLKQKVMELVMNQK